MKTDVERDHRCERKRLGQETNMRKRKKSGTDELIMGRRGKAERGDGGSSQRRRRRAEWRRG